MTISFDIDGTYADHEKEFNVLAGLLKDAGHEVGILSARSESDRYKVGFATDFEYYLGLSGQEFSGKFKVEQKAQTMVLRGIDIHFDDEPDFPPYVTVIRIKPKHER